MKVVSLFILASLHFLNASILTNIKCDYELNHYDVVGSIYQCDVIGDLTIENKNQAIISTVSQNHYGIRTNEDVLGLAVNTKYIKFFPKELEKIFKNLKLIHAQNNFIQEIGQSDIKNFPELKEFNLHNNEIKMIEEGLFQFNTKLVYVSFSNNKIFFIQSDVFDTLTHLEYLYLNSNVCIDKGAYLSHSEVLNIIDYVKIDCLAPDYKTIEQTLSKLEQESTHLSAKDFIVKIKNFEAELKKSSYSNFTSLNERLDKLKIIKPEELVALIPKSDSADFHEEKSSDIIFQTILVLVIAISVLIFGSILFLFLKRN